MTSKLYFVLLLLFGAFQISPICGQKATGPKTLRSYEGGDIPISKAEKILKSDFFRTENIDLKKEKTESDELGMTHETFIASLNGVPIEFGNYVTHSKNGKISSISGIPSFVYNLETKPSLTKEEGLEAVLEHVKAEKYIWQESHPEGLIDHHEKPKGELMILPPLEGVSEAPQLVYKYSIFATEPLTVADYYVHAHSGEMVFQHNKLCHADVPASGNSVYNGAVNFTASTYNSGYRLLNSGATTFGLETRNFNLVSGNIILSPVESSSTSFNDIGAVQAHWGAEKTLAYYQTNHNWESYDNNGSLMNIVANANGSNYTNNAFWFNNRAFFGTGDGINYDHFAAIDVVGHEVTHGVVQYSANLVYQNESGALNESFADIFGEEIELDATGQRDWIVGEQVKIGANLGLRSFSNPSAYNMPDTYYGQHYRTGSFDNGGVHFNSSVQNHWFYILSNGQSGVNDFNNSYNVSAIGATKASKIAFRNLTVYLTSTSGFYDARAGAIQSARDLYGIGSPEEIAVTNAWYAVGVGNEYGNNNPSTCISAGPVNLVITFDDRPEDIAWHLRRNTNGAITQFAGINTYTQSQANTTLTVSLGVLATGSYKFNFYDISRNGLAPSGSFMLMNGTNVIGQSGTFDLSESLDFCVTNPAGPPIDQIRPTTPVLNPAINITTTSADLSWSTSTDASNFVTYTLFYNDTFTDVYTLTNFTLSGLQPSTTYDAEVYAADVQGNFSAKGNTISFTTDAVTDTDPPTTPINLASSNIGATSFDLTWDASTDNIGVDHYDFYVDNVLAGSSTSNSINLTVPNDNTTYSCYIVAYDAAGNSSAPSSTLNVTTLPLPNGCASGALTLTITFDQQPELIGWLIQDVNANLVAAQAPGVYYNEVPGSTITIPIQALTQGDYLFTMLAASGDGMCCANGNGSYVLRDSQNAIIATGSTFGFTKLTPFCVGSSNGHLWDLDPPSEPILTASNVTSTTVDLSWTASVDASPLFGYAIYRDGVYIGDIYGNQTFVTVPNLTPNTTYDFNVVARDIWFNFTNLSNTETITTLPNGPVATLLHEGYFETGWDGWIKGGNDCARYSGNKSPEGTFSIRLRDDTGVKSSMTSPDFDLSAADSVRIDFEYYTRGFETGEDFWVMHNDGVNGWSIVATFSKGSEFTSNGFYSASVLLDDATYNLSADSKFRIQADASENNDKVWIDAIVITTYNSGPSSAIHGEVQKYDFNDFLAIGEIRVVNDKLKDEEILEANIDLHPNPTSDYITTSNNLSGKVYGIYNVEGRKVATGIWTDRVNVFDLEAGIYIVKTPGDAGSEYIGKFIKL